MKFCISGYGGMKDVYTDHITQENGKWFAEIKNEEITKREHTGNIWGWDGMSYSSLKCILEEYYNIKIPTIKELILIKKQVIGKYI